MKKYVYTVKDEQGRVFKGHIEAEDKKSAQAKLRQRSYYAMSIEEEAAPSKFKMGMQKIKKSDLAIFTQQFATMVSAGLPVLSSLNAIGDEIESEKFKEVINEVKLKVSSGTSLSDALSEHPRVFSNFFISLIKVGETAGIMVQVLERLTDYLNKEEELKQKVKSALAYPLVVCVVTGLVVAFILIFIVPVFSSVYKSLRITLPGPTITLILLSNFIRKLWWLTLAIIAGTVFAFKKILKTTKGRLLFDNFKLSLPLFGKLNRKVAVSRFIRTVGEMLSSGVPLIRCLDVAEDVVDNKVFSQIINRMRTNVNKGQNISDSFRYKKIFPGTVVQMVAAGEKSGALPTMLTKSSDFLDRDVDNLIKSLLVKLEPILTAGMAAIIGFIAMAIYLPMFDLIKQMSAR